MSETGVVGCHLHIPPVCLLIAAAAMWALDRVVPIFRIELSFIAQAGAILIFGGIAFVGLARRADAQAPRRNPSA